MILRVPSSGRGVWLRFSVGAWGIVCAALTLMADPLPALNWRPLPPLPDAYGFASPFAGVIDDTLVVAGGANFPDRQLWEGGAKTWHDRIFALKSGAAGWSEVGVLRGKLAYGVSITTPGGILCVGGSDATQHHASAFLLRMTRGAVTFEDIAPLPQPTALAAGARVGNIVYVAGGLTSPEAKEARTTLYALDLDELRAGWRTLPSLPGPGRFQAVAAAAGDYFYLFSGLRFDAKPGGGAAVSYLKDAYRFAPSSGWERLPDLPHPAAAAASPAPLASENTILVIGGVDGSGAGSAPQDFRLVPQRIQAFDVKIRSWSPAGNAPVGRVCVTTVAWNGRWVLPSGERSAGVRSPEVWSVQRRPPAVEAGK
jgi:N-acetylneuraminate epimerase